MLRALYPPSPTPPPPIPASAAPAPAEDAADEIWARVNSFLDDAGGLMALRVQLLAMRAAGPWMAPVPGAETGGGGGRGGQVGEFGVFCEMDETLIPIVLTRTPNHKTQQGAASTAAAGTGAGAAAAAASEAMPPPPTAPVTTTQGGGGNSGDLGLGWRLASRCLHDQHQHAYARFRRRCQAHGPLLQAIEAEMMRLAAALAAVDQQQLPPVPAAQAGAVAAPPGLAQQLAAVDGAQMLETRLALWRRLRGALLALVTVAPGENLAAAAAVDGMVGQGQGPSGASGATGGGSSSSSSMVVVE